MPAGPNRNQELPQTFGIFAPPFEYLVDAAQRSVLFWNVMRQRGNRFRQHLAKAAPDVLDNDVELVVDGRSLQRPVSYVLVRIGPPKTVEIESTRRPFVVVIPAALPSAGKVESRKAS